MKNLDAHCALIKKMRLKGNSFVEIIIALEKFDVKTTQPDLSVFCKKNGIKKGERNILPSKKTRIRFDLKLHHDFIKKARAEGASYSTIKNLLESRGVEISAMTVNNYCRKNKFSVLRSEEINKSRAIWFIKEEADIHLYHLLKDKINFPYVVRQWFKVTANQIRKSKNLPLPEMFELPRFTASQLSTLFPEKKWVSEEKIISSNDVRINVLFEEENLKDLILIRENMNVQSCMKDALKYGEAVHNLAFTKHKVFQDE